MLIRMAIAESDQEYLKRLWSVLEEYENLSLSVYTERSSLESALTGKKFDVLLFSPDLYEGQIALGKDTLKIMLLDDDLQMPETCREFCKINKYQRISRIYNYILGLYAEHSKNVSGMVGNRPVFPIAFYSPAGGSGKTTLALVTASKLAAQGYQVFYLNLEDIASDECYLPQTGEKGLSELVAMLGTDINFPLKLQSLLQKKTDNFYYLKHFDSPNDIQELTVQEIEEMLVEIERSGIFDILIVDMGVAPNAGALCVFEQMRKIVLVEKADTIAEQKMQCFLSQTHIMTEYGKKMVRLLNFDRGQNVDLDTEVPLIGRISMMQNPDSGQLITALANQSGINYIEALLS